MKIYISPELKKLYKVDEEKPFFAGTNYTDKIKVLSDSLLVDQYLTLAFTLPSGRQVKNVMCDEVVGAVQEDDATWYEYDFNLASDSNVLKYHGQLGISVCLNDDGKMWVIGNAYANIMKTSVEGEDSNIYIVGEDADEILEDYDERLQEVESAVANVQNGLAQTNEDLDDKEDKVSVQISKFYETYPMLNGITIDYFNGKTFSETLYYIADIAIYFGNGGRLIPYSANQWAYICNDTFTSSATEIVFLVNDTNITGKLKVNSSNYWVKTTSRLEDKYTKDETKADIVKYQKTVSGQTITNVKQMLDYLADRGGGGAFQDLGTISSFNELNSLADGYYVFEYSSSRYIMLQATISTVVRQTMFNNNYYTNRVKVSGTWTTNSFKILTENNIVTDFVDPTNEQVMGAAFAEEMFGNLGLDIDSIREKIPLQASSSNQLADKNFVNSSIATNTSYPLGALDLVDDLGLTLEATRDEIVEALNEYEFEATKTNNDYVYVCYPNAVVSTAFDKFEQYKWNSNEETFKWQFELNNSSFTAQQWASINSGITSAMVGAIPSDASSSNKLVSLATVTAMINDIGSQLATVATTGSYDDLTDTPEIPTATSDLTNDSGFITSSDLTDYAEDDSVVHNNGNENVNGVKTFTSSPIVPTPTTSTQAANKSYVDGKSRSFVVEFLSDFNTTFGKSVSATTETFSISGNPSDYDETDYAGIFDLKRGDFLVFDALSSGNDVPVFIVNNSGQETETLFTVEFQAVHTNAGSPETNELTELCFTAEQANSTVTLTKSGSPSWTGEYSRDRKTWTTYTPSSTGNITLSNVGDKVYFRGNITANFSTVNYLQFTMSGKISGSGNVNSMYVKTNYNGLKTLTYTYCYYSIFKSCSSLTTPPELPATTLSQDCYDSMFKSCSSLTKAPELPATTLASYCYSSMFSFCSKLSVAPELPATTLVSYCYSNMFNTCSSLIKAPSILPATTLVSSCYQSMFYACSSLSVAPILPATTLVSNCYNSMFAGCSKLKEIKLGYTGSFNSSYFPDWLYQVGNSGYFYYLGTDYTRDKSAIPNGWTIIPSTPTGVQYSNNGTVQTNPLKFWKGTQAQYDAIVTKDADTFYMIVEA